MDRGYQYCEYTTCSAVIENRLTLLSPDICLSSFWTFCRFSVALLTSAAISSTDAPCRFSRSFSAFCTDSRWRCTSAVLRGLGTCSQYSEAFSVQFYGACMLVGREVCTSQLRTWNSSSTTLAAASASSTFVRSSSNLPL